MEDLNPLFNYRRRISSPVFIGNTPMGGENPIRIQSMTNTPTMDTDACVQQSIRIVEAGGEYVRLTAQGVREAENLINIKDNLRKLGYNTPLIADIHFNPKAADVAAGIVEKVRINPGNFVDPVKTFETVEYSEEEYTSELEKIRNRFIPFLDICKENNTAIRIGVNHGSLSDRIMSRYGDTPKGMVESCMEFLRICITENFSNVVISIKASNTFVMVRTVRLLVHQMNEENMSFPLHLGVTEAGEGEDGRIKSSVGIGTLLLEGLGDTIRVSLSEDPEAEIPVAQSLVESVKEKSRFPSILENPSSKYNALNPERRKTVDVKNIGGNNVPVVISDQSNGWTEPYNTELNELSPDFIYVGKNYDKTILTNISLIVDYSSFLGIENTYPLFSLEEKNEWINYSENLHFIILDYGDLDESILNILRGKLNCVILLQSDLQNLYAQKAFIHCLMNNNINNPIILKNIYNESDLESFQIHSALDCGAFLLDMLIDGVMLKNLDPDIELKQIDKCSFNILQAANRRITKTEYISCPSCGRTLFDLQSVIKKVKLATAHLTGLKIAIMGCIVNGPGEMADADYGYVGAGYGKVSLYRGKTCILKNIPEENAVDELLKLISSDIH